MREEMEKQAIERSCAAFAEALAEHLIRNGKGARWPVSDTSWLAMRCAQEVEELRYETDRGFKSGVPLEALDVAAFAMMIWDNTARRSRCCRRPVETGTEDDE